MPALGPEAFSRRMAARAEQVEDRSGEWMALYVRQVVGNVVRGTPVKTGRARAGWTRTRSRVRTPQAPLSAVEQRRVKDIGDRLVRNGRVDVVNRVPYIGLLERGRSRQASKGILLPAVRATRVPKGFQVFGEFS